jgi:hypothetical protein
MSTVDLMPMGDLSTRKKRRRALVLIRVYLCSLRDAERACLDNVPPSLWDSDSFESGEYAVEGLEEVIELIGDAY